ncbi:MAG: ribonuclease PH [Chloroflexi bacterium]|nr:ribonuclease PH [Chloroflexota bacterium]
MTRTDGRKPDEKRPVTITTGYLPWAEGSAMIDMGGTQVLCAVTIENRLPAFLRGTGSGWVTAEYGMLPRSTMERTDREAARGRQSGRTQEIQRLVGRSLRAVTNLDILGDRTFTIDCDVLKADGGTRTASITGAYVALHQAMQTLVDAGTYAAIPMSTAVAATSAGIVEGVALLDLCYEEDAAAGVDFNFVMTGDGRFVEVQGTAEDQPFSREEMEELFGLADKGIKELLEAQQQALGGPQP